MRSSWFFLVGRAARWLAPVALLAAFWLRTSEELPGSLRITVDRAQALERARAEAARLGFTPEPSGAIKVHANLGRQSGYYHHPESAALAQWLPPYDIRVALPLTEGEGFFVHLAGDGSPLGFEATGTEDGANPAERARSLAQQEMDAWLARASGWRAGMVQTKSSEEASEKRFSWKLQAPGLPGPEGTAEAVVRGGRLVRFSVSSGSDDERLGAGRIGIGILTGLGAVLAVCTAIYALRLYIRRRREEETPRERAILLVALFTALGLLSVLFNVDAAGEGDAARDLTSWITILITALITVFSFLGGLLLAAAYSGTDGELREGYPGKLTSLDAVLSGRWFSRIAGRSVVTGAVWACWTLLGLALLLLAFAPRTAVTLPQESVALALGRAPAATLAARAGLHITWIAIAGLFVPLAYVHRNVRRPRLRVALLLAVPFLLALVSQDKASALGPLVSTGLMSAASLALPFLAADLLAALSSFALFSLLAQTSALWPLVSAWHANAAILVAAALVLVLVFARAAGSGAAVDATDVLPAYVGNLQRRLFLRAEVNAARQAQLRLLPQKLPQPAGLKIAAVCLPANEVSGDFYDFTPLQSEELAVFVASGGRSPVASALAIALAKGFLSCDLDYGGGPDESLGRLRQLLRHTLGEASDHLDLTLATVTPATGSVQLARSSTRPAAWLLAAGGSTEIAGSSVQLSPGESLLLHSPGLLRLLDDQSASGIRDWFQRLALATPRAMAQQVLDALLDRAGGRKRKRLNAARLRADVTAVVITREGA